MRKPGFEYFGVNVGESNINEHTMAPEEKGDTRNRIPISFSEADEEANSGAPAEGSDTTAESDAADLGVTIDTSDANGADDEHLDDAGSPPHPSPQADGSGEVAPRAGGGPEVAELVATRAELKRLEGEVKELRDSVARRQADFENYRKRMDRERAETYNRVVADIAAKLLPVLDNLKRALETEASLEASESDEFRHFLSGVDLIYKQLAGVLDALGVKPVLAEGEPFDPHLHEAVVTEPTDDYEPDTVIQEIVRGFRMGDKLIRPSLVKVAVKK
jgi:molecular chaperone GrpE